MDLANQTVEFVFYQLDYYGYIERADLDFYTWLFWLWWPFILVSRVAKLQLALTTKQFAGAAAITN